ncbi:MAG: DNA-3-methyladenine glycosylase, partial [Verrucomicrobiota bacterium]
VRAIEPLHGQEQMLKRRKMKRMENRLTAGPGTLSQALGITKDLDRTNLTGNKIWIEDHNITFSTNQIRQGTRVGVHYAGKHSKYLWRFSVKNNPWVSPAK